MSQRTIDLARSIGTNLRQKAAPVAGSSHFYSGWALLDQADELEKFMKYMVNKYGMDRDIELKDKIKILEDYTQLRDALFFNVVFRPVLIRRIRKYLPRYFELYSNKELDGQERLALPNLYADALVKVFNDPTYVATFGKRRLWLDQNNYPLFCHSIYYLCQTGVIKLHDFSGIGSTFSITYYRNKLLLLL